MIAIPAGGSEAQANRYESPVFHFRFTYPADYFLKEVSPSYLLLRRQSDAPTHWRIMIAIEEDHNYRSNTRQYPDRFEDFARQRSALLFCADGPSSSQFADSLVSFSDVRIPPDITGKEIYLRVVSESYDDETDELIEYRSSISGPVFFLDLSPVIHNRDRALVLKHETDDPQTEKVLRALVSSLEFIRQP